MRPADRALHAVLALAFAAIVLRCGWLSDDASITLRTLDNFVHGYGLRYNPAERVQAFTHPLWLLWLLPGYALTRDAWTFPLLAGLLTSVAALLVGLRTCRTQASALALAAGCAASKALVDFATAGLENPLENLLLTWFVAEACGRARAERLVLVAALLGTTRLDSLWLVLPATVAAAGPVRSWGRLWPSALPLALWHAFALFYYGSLLPNPALAKLGAGVSHWALARQSLATFAWTAEHDPFTLPAIALGFAAALSRRRALAVGIALHLGWVVWVGGDFMGGRFFVAPLWVALLVLAGGEGNTAGRRGGRPQLPWVVLALAALSLLSPYAPLRSGPAYERAPARGGVVDERGYYWRTTGWWVDRRTALPRQFYPQAGDGPVVVRAIAGTYGYTAGPRVHVIDPLGLTDPLLARLPLADRDDWRIGHFRRALPEGYVASVGADQNQIADPDVFALYDAVRLATRAPLFAPGRSGAILALALRDSGMDVR